MKRRDLKDAIKQAIELDPSIIAMILTEVSEGARSRATLLSRKRAAARAFRRWERFGSRMEDVTDEFLDKVL